MRIGIWSTRAVASAALLTLASIPAARAADGPDADVAGEIRALRAELKASQARLSELEAKQNDNWLTEERASQIRGIVQDVLNDAHARGQFADGPDIGYKDGFYIQTADKNYKLVVGGFAQVRYTFGEASRYNAGTGTLPVSGRTVQNPGDTNGFDVRRARISFSGNALTPDLTFKMEGDFYGNATGNFTVTDAFVAYRWTDQLRFKIGSYKVPFAKAELTSDTVGEFTERPEVLSPFDPVRALGISLYGELIKDKLGYEVSVNDGSRTNTLRQSGTVNTGGTPTANLDNRLAYYARVQYAGNGKIADFAEEMDLRTDNREFIWLLGAAAGYESQSNSLATYPTPQGSLTIPGLPSGNGGYTGAYILNGDIFRGTVDWSAKYQGWSFNTAGYIQQVNANEAIPANGSGSNIPAVAVDSSFFQWGAYGQVGYFIIPQKLELIGRAGVLSTEGAHDMGEFYSVGADYYVYGNNFKIQSDLTFTPEAPYTDAAANLLQNTHDIAFRLQLQLKF